MKNFYIAEFNRCVGDNIQNVVRTLRRKGYTVSRIRHKTTVAIRRPDDRSFRRFKTDLAALVQPNIGSMVLASTSGRIWLLDNKGNSPGELQRITDTDI